MAQIRGYRNRFISRLDPVGHRVRRIVVDVEGKHIHVSHRKLHVRQHRVLSLIHIYMRTRMALLSGADLVLEMPVFGSVASAEDFASCGVSMAARTGAADFLSFGSESGDLKLLERQAALYDAETPEVSARIRDGLKRGLSWPRAREEAFLHTDAPVPVSPNDILACEYLRAIKSHGSSMLPVPVERNDGGYHSSGRKGSFASATAIRKALAENDLDFLTEVVPEAFFSCLKLESCPQVTACLLYTSRWLFLWTCRFLQDLR